MAEHFNKSTVEASVWCAKCGRATMHRINDGRRGSCLICLDRLNAEHQERAEAQPEAEQLSLAQMFAAPKHSGT